MTIHSQMADGLVAGLARLLTAAACGPLGRGGAGLDVIPPYRCLCNRPVAILTDARFWKGGKA